MFRKGETLVAVREQSYPRELYVKGDVGTVIQEVETPGSTMPSMTQVYVWRTRKYVWIYEKNWRVLDGQEP